MQLPGEKWDKVSGNYHTTERSQQKADQAVLCKGNTGYLKGVRDWAHSGLGVDNASLFMWRRQILGTETWTPHRPKAQTGLAKSALGRDTELGSLCHVIRTSEKTLGQSSSQRCWSVVCLWLAQVGPISVAIAVDVGYTIKFFFPVFQRFALKKFRLKNCPVPLW